MFGTDYKGLYLLQEEYIKALSEQIKLQKEHINDLQETINKFKHLNELNEKLLKLERELKLMPSLN